MAINLQISCTGIDAVNFLVAEGDTAPQRKAIADLERLDTAGVDGARYRVRCRIHAPMGFRCWAGFSSLALCDSFVDRLLLCSGQLARVSIVRGGVATRYDAVVDVDAASILCRASPLIDETTQYPAHVSCAITVNPLADV